MPKVSIVIPNYNHARFLRRRIESVLRQTYQDIEVILLDDCSADESQSILLEYADDPRVRIEFNAVNSGRTSKQWNKGVRLARGEYVWIAESDDYADEQLLEKLVSILDAEPNMVLAYCRSWIVLANGEISGPMEVRHPGLDAKRWTTDFQADGREECQNYLIRCPTIPNASAVVFRKEAYMRVGGADENLVLCGDWKLWSAMALTGRIAYLGEPLNYYQSHDKNIRERIHRLGLGPAEHLEMVRWFLEILTPSDAVRRMLSEDAFSLWAAAVDVLAQREPEVALKVIDGFMRLSGPEFVKPSIRANTWLTVAGIHYRQGRPAKAMISASRAVLVRPVILGRPVMRALTHLAGAFKE
jgi:glycosyltransferase involved in cell wall biosynthesis